MSLTPKKRSPPLSLVLHDGELADVCKMLEDLGTPVVERIGGLTTNDFEISWSLVIATPKHMIELGSKGWDTKATQIAILAQNSRTLSNSLRRAGVQLIVQRPVHPAALRALILNSLYQGPEKRHSLRVSIGAPVRLRVGFKQRLAILADLSASGCRLICNQRLEPNKTLKMRIPSSVAAGSAFTVKGRVLSCSIAEEGLAGTFVVTTEFQNVTGRMLVKLSAAVAAHATGPAADPSSAAR